ncbi:VOC family protein, partial [Sinorhizobium meliloti]|uniref:VOC family protein n=1 Tax=Rhizobium meliloti TaxID=382 RepID=UPI001F46D34B
MSQSKRTARPLDHLVLPVADLARTRQRLAALGFTVADEARHPFGTANACVFFSDDTYLEPLAVASREECEAAALEGNAFVARDQAFRFRQALPRPREIAHRQHEMIERAGGSLGLAHG